MAKKNTPEAETKQKIQTKYDRKMEARRQQKIKEAKQEKMAKIIAATVGILLAAAIVLSVGISFISKNRALHGTYVKIGSHELSQLEYDYYYNTAVNNYLVSYSSILPYMGLDTSADFSKQQYTDNMTWKDLFDQMAVEQIQQTKAIADDAAAAGFSYDTSEEYQAFASNMQEGASAEGVSLKEYYKQNLGAYATEKNTEPFVKESLLANAYYEELLSKNAPSEEEIKAYYEENKNSYDKVDYRSFTFTTGLSAEATEEETSKAMEELGEKAEAMMEARKEGRDFEELCMENAPEDAKANYEDEETEFCLSEGRTYSGITGVMSQWLYEDGRKKDDIAVLKDDSLNQYYVVEFIKRYYDEADDANISNTLATQKTADYMAGLTESYEVTDVAGKLKYLTIPPAEETEEDGSSEAGAEDMDADESESNDNAEDTIEKDGKE